MAVIHHGSLAVVHMTCLSGLVAIAFSPAVTAAFAADQPASVQTRTGGHSRFSGHHASGGHVSNRQNPTVLQSKPHFRTFVGPHRLFVPFLGFDRCYSRDVRSERGVGRNPAAFANPGGLVYRKVRPVYSCSITRSPIRSRCR